MWSLNELVAGGEAALETMKNERMQESVTLDFKTDHEDAPLFKERNLSKHGRFVFAKAISAFANTGGGRIIVGVDCAKDDEGIDCVRELIPIENYEAICSALSHVSSTIVQPSVPGLDVHHIPSEIEPGRGYIIVEVPRSERRPHRCEAAGKQQYFKRSGSSSIGMEHYEIEDAFRRLGTADLEIEAQLRRAGRLGGTVVEYYGWLDVLGHNDGAASAKSIALHFAADTGFNYLLGASKKHDQQYHRVGVWNVVQAPSGLVVHPGQTTLLYSLHFTVEPVHSKLQITGQNGGLHTYEIPYRIYAENMREKSGILTFTNQQVLTEIVRA